MLRSTLTRATLALACASVFAHTRDASTQVLPPPRRVVIPPAATRPSPPPAPAPAPPRLHLGWSEAELRARPWLLGQTSPHGGGYGDIELAPTHDPSLDEGPLDARMAAVARAYLAWGRVDDELRWAPYLCRMPSPSRARLSQADVGSHAQKVYFLYARDHRAYITRTSSRLQVVVKESWTHRPVDLAHAMHIGGGTIAARTPEGRTVEPDRFAGLFVMMRVDARDPRSDRGWVYGTVSPTGAVTSVGRVASCMGCHVEAGPGRLFGLGGSAHGG